jgi:hypothetical protein
MAEIKKPDNDENSYHKLLLGSELPQDYQCDSGVYRRIKVVPFESNGTNEKKTKPIVDDVWGDEDNIKSYSKKDGEVSVKEDRDASPKCIDDIFDRVIGHYEETALDRAKRLKQEEIKSKK